MKCVSNAHSTKCVHHQRKACDRQLPHRLRDIELRASNAAVAAGLDGDTAIVDLEHGQPTIPSAIFFDAEKGRVSYGRDAIRNYVEGTEGRLMRALKSILGSSLVEETTFVEGRPLSYKDV